MCVCVWGYVGIAKTGFSEAKLMTKLMNISYQKKKKYYYQRKHIGEKMWMFPSVYGLELILMYGKTLHRKIMLKSCCLVLLWLQVEE